MPFPKGVSGNPKGRPRVGESLAAALRERFPVARLCDLAERLAVESDDDRVRLQALLAIWDRAHGKPKEVLEIEGGISESDRALLMATRMTPHERRQALAAQDSTEPDAAAIDD